MNLNSKCASEIENQSIYYSSQSGETFVEQIRKGSEESLEVYEKPAVFSRTLRQELFTS